MDARLTALKAKLNEIRYELDEHRHYNNPNRSADSARNLASKALATGSTAVLTDALSTLLAKVSDPNFGFDTPEYRVFKAKDDEIIERHNKIVAEYNEIASALRNERANKRETAKIRAAMCEKCFTVHRPEVECY